MPKTAPTSTVARRPHRRASATEPARAVLSIAALAAATPLLRTAPRGEGGPVLVLPGLLTSDLATLGLRALLRQQGHDAHGWGLGVNIGPTQTALDALSDRVAHLARRSGRPVSLVGWSLGGLFARLLASTQPADVRQVITLGTPFALTDRSQTIALRGYELFGTWHAPGYALPMPPAVRGPLPVPATSIWSRSDGVVSWTASVEAPGSRSQNIAVHSSHAGLSHHPGSLWAIADRLAQAPGQWRPFQGPRPLRHLFDDADRHVAAVSA